MPKTEENMSILKDRNGRDVALKGVKIQGRLHGLMAEVEVEQSYVNPQDINIEAIYTFPLPLGSTLLGLEVEIAGKKLTGSVVEKKKAERQYEDAITDGNSAIMLEEAGPGLYTVSLGNLMAGESAVIRYRYALLLSWHGSLLRFMLPTTIAPRYGNAEAAGIRPHQVPTSSLSIDYPLEIKIDVEGDLANSLFASPSHPISIERGEKGVVVHIAGKAFLDRDFILTLQSENAQSSCLLVPDGKNQVALASLRIPPIEGVADKPLALKVVIDCSGSMAGTSIIQARKAALEILNLLTPQDSFNVTLFGDRHKHLFKRMMPAIAKNVTAAWNWLEEMNADMGGTEMESAIEAAFSLGNGSEGIATVLLITDGEIHEHEKLELRAKNSGHRIFTVGVGNAVAETFLKILSAVTGGACELVAPQEGMTERVLMQFHRMRQPILSDIKVAWPSMPDWQTSLPSTIFAGDTVHVFAGFSQTMEGVVKLSVRDGVAITAPIIQSIEAEIPRVAAANRMSSTSSEECLKLALDYQLLSHWTNFLVVAERLEKADELPELHQIPQMLAAGWGAVGTAHKSAMRVNNAPSARFSIGTQKANYDNFDDGINFSDIDMPSVIRTARHRVAVEAIKASGIEAVDIPGFLRKQASTHVYMEEPSIQFIEELAGKYSRQWLTPEQPKTIAELVQAGLDAETADCLWTVVGRGYKEAEVVASFLYALTQTELGNQFGRAYTRVVLKHWKNVVKDPAVDVEISKALGQLKDVNWLRAA